MAELNRLGMVLTDVLQVPTVLTHRAVAAMNRWDAVPQSDWPTAQAQRDIILQDFDPADSGHRRSAAGANGRDADGILRTT